MKDRIILHSDLNNCYASIELLHRPEYRKMPFAVGGDEEARHGIILAKNDIAKQYQIKTGEAIWQAKQKCPVLVTVKPNYSLYLRFARMAREIYANYTNQIEHFGIDESWLDITGSLSLFGNGKRVADEIRTRMKEELGLTASVGVSWNKIFAKLGSDMRKPDATTVISREDFREQVWPLPASDLLYVGPATTRKLKSRGIYSIGDLARCDPNYIQKFLHKPGIMLWSFANGYDTAPVAQNGEESMIKSIGNSTTCPRDLENDQDVRATLYMLGESVAARLRESGLEAKTIQIYVRDKDLSSFVRQDKLDLSTNLTAELVPAAFKLFQEHYTWSKPIRSLGIRGSDLIPAKRTLQLTLFADEGQRQKIQLLEETVDKLRERFGYFSIQRALLLADPKLNTDAKSTHTIHPVPYNRG